LIKGHSNQV